MQALYGVLAVHSQSNSFCIWVSECEQACFQLHGIVLKIEFKHAILCIMVNFKTFSCSHVGLILRSERFQGKYFSHVLKSSVWSMGFCELPKKENIEAPRSESSLQQVFGNYLLFIREVSYSVVHYMFEFRLYVKYQIISWFEHITI